MDGRSQIRTRETDDEGTVEKTLLDPVKVCIERVTDRRAVRITQLSTRSELFFLVPVPSSMSLTMLSRISTDIRILLRIVFQTLAAGHLAGDTLTPVIRTVTLFKAPFHTGELYPDRCKPLLALSGPNLRILQRCTPLPLLI
jgi:hypothetical protein